MMSVKLVVTRPSSLGLGSFKNTSRCCYKTDANKGILSELEVEETPAYDVEPKYTQKELDRITNKSRLEPQHRNIMHGIKPYEHAPDWYHQTVWYKKRILGKYGIEAAACSPAVVWPTKDLIENQLEYEKIAYPVPIKQLWEKFEQQKIEEKETIRKREEDIDKVVANFDKWRATLKAKQEKKDAELLAAKLKKEKALQAIKEEFGYYIDPRDEKFKEMMEQKEKEDKKKKKAEKKKMKQDKLMAYLAQQEEQVKARKKAEEAEKEENVEKKVE